MSSRVNIIMVVQSLENLENLEKSGNFTERAKDIIANNAFSYLNQAWR